MIRPRSIKRKLQSWVVIIFVLTGTAGWAGIWGLLYISSSTSALADAQVKRAEEAGAVRSEIAAARRIDRDYLLAAALDEGAKQRVEGARVEAAWAKIGAQLKQLRAGSDLGSDAFASLESTQGQVAAAWAKVEEATSGGTGVIEVRAGPYADYEKRVADLEKQAAGVTDGAIGAVKAQTATVYDRIKALGFGLFATVLLCQLFSAWAGRQLSTTLTGELNALRDSAERISLGDLKNAVMVTTTDIEIVEVGEALDRLRVSLSKAMDRLAAKRAPRPAEG